jgi:hypothetical protein
MDSFLDRPCGTLVQPSTPGDLVPLLDFPQSFDYVLHEVHIRTRTRGGEAAPTVEGHAA